MPFLVAVSGLVERLKQNKVTCEEKAVEHNKTPSQSAQSFETLPPRTPHFPAQKEFSFFCLVTQIYPGVQQPAYFNSVTLSHGKSGDFEVYRVA